MMFVFLCFGSHRAALQHFTEGLEVEDDDADER